MEFSLNYALNTQGGKIMLNSNINEWREEHYMFLLGKPL